MDTTVKKIVAPVTGAIRDKVVLKTAFAAAKPFDAHIVALFVHSEPNYAVPYDGMSVSASVSPQVVEALVAAVKMAEERARATMDEVAAGQGAQVTNGREKTAGLSCSFRVRHGLFARGVAEEAQLSDLVVFGPLSTSDESKLSESFLDTLTRIERPVLVAPAAPVQFARHVAIAWDGGLASSHAVIGALPYIARAESVDVISIGDGCDAGAMDDLKAYLALHGVTARKHIIERTSAPIAETLMQFASKNGNDLLIMGGYGHNYFRETIFGGVTAHIRWHATLPILMVH